MSLPAVRIEEHTQEFPPAPQVKLVPQAETGDCHSRCNADWRRPSGYWACVRRAGHRGRHWMRATERSA